MKRSVHYEVRDQDGEHVYGSMNLQLARRQAVAERNCGYPVTIHRVTTIVEEVPLCKRTRTKGNP